MDGKSVIKCDQLSFRYENEAKIKGMHFQTFFGGVQFFLVDAKIDAQFQAK